MNEIQRRDNAWREANGLNDPFQSLDIIRQELDELSEAIREGNVMEILLEVPDLILPAIGILGMYNIDVEAVLDIKMSRNEVKYNPEVTQELVNEGMTVIEAIAEQKARWDKKRDYQFVDDYEGSIYFHRGQTETPPPNQQDNNQQSSCP